MHKIMGTNLLSKRVLLEYGIWLNFKLVTVFCFVVSAAYYPQWENQEITQVMKTTCTYLDSHKLIKTN